MCIRDRKITSYSLMMMLISVILYIIGIKEIVPALAGTGLLVSIVLGFSLRVLLENFIAGIMLFMTGEISIGDYIIINKNLGHEGRVVERTFRYTILLDKDRNKIKIPNSKLVSEISVKKRPD